jgi:hypothetical protein
LKPDGSPDPSFDQSAPGVGSEGLPCHLTSGLVTPVAPLSDGRIAVAHVEPRGRPGTYPVDSTERMRVSVRTADGTALDPGFGVGGTLTGFFAGNEPDCLGGSGADLLVPRRDGSFLVGFHSSFADPWDRDQRQRCPSGVFRVGADGAIDPTFGVGGVAGGIGVDPLGPPENWAPAVIQFLPTGGDGFQQVSTYSGPTSPPNAVGPWRLALTEHDPSGRAGRIRLLPRATDENSWYLLAAADGKGSVYTLEWDAGSYRPPRIHALG